MDEQNPVEYVRATSESHVRVEKFWQPLGVGSRFILQVPARGPAGREWVDVDLSEDQARELFKNLQDLLDN